MAHTVINFEHLIGQVRGLSEKQLRNHFELYEGYVKKLNEIEENLKTADRSKANYSYAVISELKRRHAVAFNGAHLHEIYFENLTGKSTKPSGDLADAINKAFGSIENWHADTLAGLKTAVGWVVLTHSRIDGALHNCVLEEHHRGLFVEQDILLAIDGWEHAYMIDYGVKKADYYKSIQSSIDWEVASRRYEWARRSLIAAA